MILQCSSSEPLHDPVTFETPLSVSCKVKNTEICCELLNHSPNLVLRQDAYMKFTALHHACINKDPKLLTLLLSTLSKLLTSQKGSRMRYINLDVRDVNGFTPLLHACDGNNLVAAECLLSFSQQNPDVTVFDVNAQENLYSRTPLHMAVSNGNVDLIKMLITTNSLDLNLRARASTRAIKFLIERCLRHKNTSDFLVYSVAEDNKNTTSSCPGKCSKLTKNKLTIIRADKKNAQCDFWVTPLTEACMHEDVHKMIDILLTSGGCVDDGYACQVCDLIGDHNALQKILSHHVEVLKHSDLCTASDTMPSSEHTRIRLNWNSKNLHICKSAWFGEQTVFFPNQLSTDLKYDSVTVVDLCNNHLKELPSELFMLPMVYEIDVSHNIIKKLPTVFSHSLTILKFSHNIVTEIPIELWKLPNITEVDGHCNEIFSFGINDHEYAIFVCNCLCSLNLSGNKLDTLKPQMFQTFNRLRTLNLSTNYLTSLPESLWKCSSLETLDLSGNKLCLLVEYEGCKSAMTMSDSSLRYLNVSDNRFTVFPTTIPCLAPNLVKLNISKNAVKELHIQLIPKDVEVLLAKECEIARILINDHEEENAKHFGCIHRKHKQLPHLVSLNLTKNHLKHFKVLISEESEEKFISVTEEQLCFPSLEHLNLSENDLDGCFNHNIGNQLALKTLNLNKNRGLKQLPLSLGNLKRSYDSEQLLRKIEINDMDSLKEPPVEFQSKGCKAILSYLKSKHQG